MTSRAQMPEPQPALVVPPVPPRTIDPPPVTLPPVQPMPPDDPPAPPTTTTNKPKPSRPPVEAKPDPKPEQPPPDTIAAVPNPPPVAPLRSAQTPTGPEASKQIRDIINNTQMMLDKVDYPNQSDDRKAHYTSAKALLQQAEEALKKEELTQARSFAERAQSFARLLAGRS
jgi:hypothetical protein